MKVRKATGVFLPEHLTKGSSWYNSGINISMDPWVVFGNVKILRICVNSPAKPDRENDIGGFRYICHYQSAGQEG